MMFPEKTMKWGRSRNCIRELFEYGLGRKAAIGAENVYDFSLGNPSIPSPPCVNETISRLIAEQDPIALHGYTSAPGRPTLRAAIANNLNERYGTNMVGGDIFVTCGAAAGIAAFLRCLLMPGDEVIAFAPFFPEYTVFTEASGGKLVVVPLSEPDFQMNAEGLAAAITERTRCVIVNSPNNPSGVVLTEESIKAMVEVLEKAQEKYGEPIYILSDEPYRELVYDGVEVPCLMNYYDNTVICYSFSKALSIPGERIGYLAVSDKAAYREDLNFAIAGASRALGHINAPSLLQQVMEQCLGETSDISK
ncbi:MAG: pyridoxal phosphate-dependent aminotransferase, partial [Oscillospiraceae bacterium]|nr:pyridoxal phosphate-dependent aminotransferase [Oscillospiraceae bacterium]